MVVSTQNKTAGTKSSKASKKTSKKTSKKAKPPAAVATPTFVALVFDESGSMSSHRDGAVKMANSLFSTLVKEDKLSNTHVTVIGFDGAVQPPKQRDVKPEWLKSLTEWRVAGSTALLDAVAEAIKLLEEDQDKLVKKLEADLAALPKRTLKAKRLDLQAQIDAAKAASFLVTTVTDGEENASDGFRRAGLGGPDFSKFAALLRQRTATDKWTFTFSLPKGYDKTWLSLTGMPAGNVSTWSEAKTVEKDVVRGASTYFASRRAGTASVQNFFVANTADIKKKDLKGYEDISDKVKIWNVDKECAIQEFVESHNQPYLKGHAFYQLTKKEDVQGYKDVLVVERSVDPSNGKEIFGKVFKDARDLIGLPNNDVKVTPGSFGNYVLFVQSTSNNRRLVRGSKLIYLLP